MITALAIGLCAIFNGTLITMGIEFDISWYVIMLFCALFNLMVAISRKGYQIWERLNSPRPNKHWGLKRRRNVH